MKKDSEIKKSSVGWTVFVQDSKKVYGSKISVTLTNCTILNEESTFVRELFTKFGKQVLQTFKILLQLFLTENRIFTGNSHLILSLARRGYVVKSSVSSPDHYDRKTC